MTRLQLKQLQLEGSGYQWLHKLLVAFNAGDLEAYEGLCATHAAELSAQPALVASAVKLREKITILCLMEIIFAYVPPARNRSAPLPRSTGCHTHTCWSHPRSAGLAVCTCVYCQPSVPVQAPGRTTLRGATAPLYNRRSAE